MEFFDRAGRHRLGPLFELTAYTGLRRGEITGLHWADVDLVDRQIVVRHNRVSVDGRIQETTTKTRSGRRTVPLNDAAVAALLTYLAAPPGRGTRSSPGSLGDARPCVHDGGRQSVGSGLRHQVFQKIRKQGEPLPELTFHGLRHCAGSLWLAAGVDISIVSKLLGHSSIAITADIYAHMLKGVGQRAVDGAAELIAHTVHSQQAVSG